MRRDSIMPLLLKSVKSLRSSLCKVSLQPHYALCNVASHGHALALTSSALLCLGEWTTQGSLCLRLSGTRSECEAAAGNIP